MTAASVAEQVAVRVADPTVLAEAVAAAARQSRYADVLPWRPASLAKGHAGIAVLCAELDRRAPGQGWDRAGHHHLAAAAAGAGPHDVSLFSGLAGVGFAAVLLAADRPRYARLLATVDAALGPLVEQWAGRLAAAQGCAARDVDLVSGLTGAGVYLLARRGPVLDRADAAERSPARAVDRTLDRLLAGLAGLLIDPGGPCGRPRRWHTPAHLSTGSLRETYPAGHYNCGLAHGVPGPLALLSIAARDGVEVPQSRQAIEVAARWLAENVRGTEDEPDWPDAVPLEAPAEHPPLPPAQVLPAGHTPGRAAWCYGAPGVARSLWLAGTALERPDWCDLAARTIRAVGRRPPATWWLSTSAFCHGRAGLLQVLRRFAADLADPALAATAQALAGDLAAEFDPASVLGLRTAEPEGALVDHPGLLDGAPGIALALLELPSGGDGATPEPGWDRMFLLS